VGGYFLYGVHRRRQFRSAFLQAVRNAKAGDDASTNKHLPPDGETASAEGYLGLRSLYTAEVVLAKGPRGCVVRAFKKNSSEKAPLAIKVLVPKDGSFDTDERGRLEREGKLLRLVASRGHRSAVHALDSGQGTLPQRDYACWFIMEALEGRTVYAEIHPDAENMDGSRKGSAVPGLAGQGTPTGVLACIQCARDVLAALKVVHSEGFAHLDVTPANIVHCGAKPQDPCHYKLVGFGSALETGTHVNSGGGPRATGSPAYRAPELFCLCTVSVACDVWSLGATMFELVTGRPPFVSQGSSDGEWATAIHACVVKDLEPDVLDSLTQDQSRSFHVNLARVITKALRKEATSR
jgi:serine/threonine protein kinase